MRIFDLLSLWPYQIANRLHLLCCKNLSKSVGIVAGKQFPFHNTNQPLMYSGHCSVLITAHMTNFLSSPSCEKLQQVYTYLKFAYLNCVHYFVALLFITIKGKLTMLDKEAQHFIIRIKLALVHDGLSVCLSQHNHIYEMLFIQYS